MSLTDLTITKQYELHRAHFMRSQSSYPCWLVAFDFGGRAQT